MCGKLTAPGAELAHVQYQLDDPAPTPRADHRHGRRRLGDRERAGPRRGRNQVAIVYRKGEFARLKQGNLTRISKAKQNGEIECLFYNDPDRIETGKIFLKARRCPRAAVRSHHRAHRR